MTISNIHLLSTLPDNHLLSACLIFLNTFLLLLISIHHTQYRKSHLLLDLSIYAALLKMISKLDSLVFCFSFLLSVMCESTVSSFHMVVGQTCVVCFQERWKLKTFIFVSFQTKEKENDHCKQLECQTAWKSQAGACSETAPVMTTCHGSCFIVRGHRFQLLQESLLRVLMASGSTWTDWLRIWKLQNAYRKKDKYFYQKFLAWESAMYV